MKLREHLNLEATDELHMFLKSTKSKTGKMKYDAFVKSSMVAVEQPIRDYLKEWSTKANECRTVTALEELKIPALPDHIRDLIVNLVDKPKDLDLVERTYLALDLFRAVSQNIGTNIGHMIMHYANAIRQAPTIVRPDGKSF